VTDILSFNTWVHPHTNLETAYVHMRGPMHTEADADLFQAKLNLAIYGNNEDYKHVVCRFLVVDMKELNSISGRGLSILSSKTSRVREIRGVAYLVAPNERVLARFQRTMGAVFDEIYEVVPDVETANQAIAAARAIQANADTTTSSD